MRRTLQGQSVQQYHLGYLVEMQLMHLVVGGLVHLGEDERSLGTLGEGEMEEVQLVKFFVGGNQVLRMRIVLPGIRLKKKYCGMILMKMEKMILN